MGSPKILHLIWSFKMAGAERIAQVILERCVREGWEAHVCALAPSDPGAKEGWLARGLRLHDVFKRPGLDFTLAARLRKILLGERISLLHTHNAVGGFYGGWARGNGMPHVHTEHSNVRRRRCLLRLVRARQLRSAVIVAVSRKVAVTLARRGGIPNCRIRVIYNGVRSVPPDGNSGDALNRELGLPHDAVVVGTVGNLRAVKDQQMLLTAFAPVAREVGNAHLLIVGEGVERGKLEARVVELGLEGRVSMPGHRSDIETVLGSLDVFVLSSRSEGLPVSLLEAMSRGCPSVSTAVGGVPEIIQDGENGLLVPAESPRALTRAIRRLLSAPAEAARMGDRARETVRQEFNETQMLDEYLGLYREML